MVCDEKTNEINKLMVELEVYKTKTKYLEGEISDCIKDKDDEEELLASTKNALESQNKYLDIGYDELDKYESDKYKCLVDKISIAVVGGPKNFSVRVREELPNCNVLIDGG